MMSIIDRRVSGLDTDLPAPRSLTNTVPVDTIIFYLLTFVTYYELILLRFTHIATFLRLH